MRVFLDTEFMEQDGHVELLSVGIVKETERGFQHFYGVNSTANTSRANAFVIKNVLPHLSETRLDTPPKYAPLPDLGRHVEIFLGPVQEKWEIWAYYADYDWVAFCSMWGRMVDLPDQFPWYCLDIKQELHVRNLSREILPPDPPHEHHALVDADWTRRAYYALPPRTRN